MNNFKFGESRKEKIDKFLDNLAWHFSTKPAMNYTVIAINKLNEKLDELNKNFKKADESSTKLAGALNKLTSYGVIVVGAGILFGLIQFLFENKIWPFSQ